MFHSSWDLFGLILILVSVLSSNGNPFSGLGGQDVDFPFGKCDVSTIGGSKGSPFSAEKTLQKQPTLAFYPLTEEETRLKLQIMFKNMVFEINIQGTMVTIEKCLYHARRNCTTENEEGVKQIDYIQPHTWNRVNINLSSQLLEISIGDRKVLSKSMADFNQNPEEAMWQVHVQDQPKKILNKSDPQLLYLVQFICKGFENRKITFNSNTDGRKGKEHPLNTYKNSEEHSTPDKYDEEEQHIPGRHHNGHSINKYNEENPSYNRHEQGHTLSESSPLKPSDPRYGSPVPQKDNSSEENESSGREKESKLVGLIVGVVVAALIIIALSIVIYNVIKKRRSMDLNEKSPLSKDDPKQQEQQQPQQQHELQPTKK